MISQFASNSNDTEDLTHVEVCVALEDLHGCGLSFTEYVPMVDGSICNQTQSRFANPLPEDDIFVHGCGLEFLLLFEIKYLQCSRLGA